MPAANVKAAGRFAFDERRKPGQGNMHRRLGEIATMELPLGPGEVFESALRDIASVRHGK